MLLLAAVAGVLWFQKPPTLDDVKASIQEQYPGVRTITADDLQAMLASENPPQLLDVREPEEYAISHLPGALRVDPGAGPEDVFSELDPDRPVVAYCSVGYRSAVLIDRLQPLWASPMFNLEGAIFAWANQGRPLVNREGPVRRVHPFDARWGQLLEEELRAP